MFSALFPGFVDFTQLMSCSVLTGVSKPLLHSFNDLLSLVVIALTVVTYDAKSAFKALLARILLVLFCLSLVAAFGFLCFLLLALFLALALLLLSFADVLREFPEKHHVHGVTWDRSVRKRERATTRWGSSVQDSQRNNLGCRVVKPDD